jgi:hypothetical protein
LIDALKRLWQAIQHLGSGQEGKSPAAGGDLMQQVGAMQTYWRAFLQEQLEAILGGTPAGYGTDGVDLTDVEQFMGPDAESAVPDATLADLDEWMDEPESHAPGAPPVARHNPRRGQSPQRGHSPRRGSSQEPGDDDTDWLSEYLDAPGDDGLDDLDMLDGV